MTEIKPHYIVAQEYTKPIFRAAHEALRDLYPQLNRLPQLRDGSIRFTVLGTIYSARISSRKDSSSISRAILKMLISFGMPYPQAESEVIRWRSQSLPEEGYADYLTSEFYLPQTILEDLVTGSGQKRIRGVIKTARTLIEGPIKSFGYRLSPQRIEDKSSEDDPWDYYLGYMVRDEASNFFDCLKDHINKKQRPKFREAKDEILNNFKGKAVKEQGGVFIARGAAIDYLLPGQKRTAPERVIDAGFDNAFVRMLAAPVMRRFVTLVDEYSDGRIHIDQQEIEEEYQKGENYEKKHQADENALRVIDALGLMGKYKKLAGLYFSSSFPLAYFRTNNPLVDPFKYGIGYTP